MGFFFNVVVDVEVLVDVNGADFFSDNCLFQPATS